MRRAVLITLGLAFIGLAGCTGKPTSYSDAVQPEPKDYRLEEPRPDPAEAVLPKPAKATEFLSANGEVCEISGGMSTCVTNGTKTSVSNIISGSI